MSHLGTFSRPCFKAIFVLQAIVGLVIVFLGLRAAGSDQKFAELVALILVVSGLAAIGWSGLVLLLSRCRPRVAAVLGSLQSVVVGMVLVNHYFSGDDPGSTPWVVAGVVAMAVLLACCFSIGRDAYSRAKLP